MNYNNFSVYQHWDPLKVCLVGRSYPPEFYSYIENPKVRNVFERIAIETEEDYQKLIYKLEEFNVTVVRTDISDNFEDHFHIDNGRRKALPPPMCPRDNTAMVGETFFMPSANYNEKKTIAHQILILEYLNKVQKQDISDVNWKSMGSVMCSDIEDELIKAETQSIGSSTKFIDNNNYYCYQSIQKFLEENNIPIIYDEYMNTACMTRVGKDLYFSSVNSTAELLHDRFRKKVSKFFPSYRSHHLGISGHSDGIFCPVKPGLIVALAGSENYDLTFPGWEVVSLRGESWEKVKPFLELKKKNDGKWWVPGEEFNDDFTDYVETWMKDWVTYVEETVFDVNMLVIDEHNVICNGYNKKVFKSFERHGITPHIVNFRHRYFWDGGLHCITSDISREGGVRKDYFPERGDKNMSIMSEKHKLTFKEWITKS